MNKVSFFLLIVCLALTSCVPIVKDKVDPVDNTTPTTNTEIAWQPLSKVSPELLIKSLHSTANEFHILTNNQLFRLDANLSVIETRALAADRQIYGTPVCSDFTFLRITQGNNNMQVVEFHLMNTKSVIKKFFTSELVDATQNESFLIDVVGRTPGAFSTDGTKFFMPGVVYPSYKPTIMIFDVLLNAQKSDFTTIKLAKRVEIPNLTTDGKIESCRYLKGNFYLATKDGGFRITPEGDVKKLFNSWTADFFEKDGKIYANGTDFNPNDFYTSSDNGVSWQRVGVAGELRFVETVNGIVFNQRNRNFPYDLVDATLTKVKPILYVNDFKERSDNYYDIEFFHNKYYISVGNQIFSISQPKAK